MADDKQGNSGDDDSYVLEDSGESIEDIEHEMEVAAQEADSTLSRSAFRPSLSPTRLIGYAAGGGAKNLDKPA